MYVYFSMWLIINFNLVCDRYKGMTKRFKTGSICMFLYVSHCQYRHGSSWGVDASCGLILVSCNTPTPSRDNQMEVAGCNNTYTITVRPCERYGVSNDIENHFLFGSFFQTDSKYHQHMTAQIAKFMGPRWGPTGSCRPQMGPMLAPWTLLSGWPFWVESPVMTNNAETYPYHAVMYIMHGFTWYMNGEVIGQRLQRS